MYLSKDEFLIPYYIARMQKVDLKLIYGCNMGDTDIPFTYRGVEIRGSIRKQVSTWNEVSDWVKYILPQAKLLRTLSFCGCSAHHMMLTWLLHQLNPNVKVVISGDMEEAQAHEFLSTSFIYGRGVSAWIKRHLAQYFFSHVLLYEANEKGHALLEIAYKKYGYSGLLSIYPCLDDELFLESGLKIKSWSSKDNIMIYVGRIGNHQKNTDMLLKALTHVNLKDWKVYLIGPITDNFEINNKSSYHQKIEEFFADNQHLRDKVIFTGMIFDQKEIFKYFIRAKVFLSAARHEGFANVYSQAAAFGCYIISTDVGGAETASNHWRFGAKVEQEDAEGMAAAIQKMIDEESSIDLRQKPDIKNFLYSNVIAEKILPCL